MRECPALMPLDTMRERVFLPMCTILVPVSACSATATPRLMPQTGKLTPACLQGPHDTAALVLTLLYSLLLGSQPKTRAHMPASTIMYTFMTVPSYFQETYAASAANDS